MTHDHFYDGSGNPITGKSPVELRIKNGPLDALTQNGLAGALNAFLGAARLSPAPNYAKTVTLSNGVTLRLTSKFGIVTVDVDVPPRLAPPDDKSEFYGGIVIRPYCISNEADYLTSAPGAVTPIDFTLGEVTTKQRPAVPTNRPSDPTTHLVIQIKNNIPLDNHPVKRGVIKIFRIKDPLVGRHAEISLNPRRYLVSAKDDFSEFYLCGKKLTRVPPLPETTYTLARVMAYGFVPTDFKSAAKATGALFVAVDKKLYGLDAGATTPAWTLLATATFGDLQYANDFGGTPTVTVAPGGAVTLVCSGSNGAGVCSTFTGVITPGTPRPSLAGSITLMHDGTVPGVSQPITYTAVWSTVGTNTTGTSMGVGTNIAEHTTTRSDTYTIGTGTMPLLPDRFLGGSLPKYTANGRSITIDWASSGTFDGWVTTSPGIEQADYTFTFSFTKVQSEVNFTQDTTTEYTWDFQQRWLGTSSSVQTFSQEYPAPITKTPDQVLRKSYTSLDLHTGKLAWRRDAQRSATTTQFPTQTGPSGGETVVPGFPGNPADTYPASGTRTVSYTAVDFNYDLLRPSGVQLVHFGGLVDLFGTTPSWASSHSVTESLAATDKYGELPTQSGGFALSVPFALDTGGPATSTGSPPTYTTEPFYYVYWTGPVGILRGGALPVNQHLPVPYPGGSSFSHTITFDDSTPTSFNATDYAALFSPSRHDVSGMEFPVGSTINVGPTSNTTLVGDSDAYCPPDDISHVGYDNHILFDMRSNGYIAWVVLATEMVSGGAWARSFTAVLGNDVSQVPLKDVIDEWRSLAALDVSSDLKQRFYESPAEVSLL